ncbi:hypothetical protein [Stenotrophomonas maltophilia]|uniref:hypothetical protein n=1 Tax=Stenotrophomonas maltophilia TaxID=40324 RepID=UPI00080BA2B1|nr:hypothetical protein [Stenotrophomonas maltophilia]
MSKSDYPDYPPQRARRHRITVGEATFIVTSNVDGNKRWIREVHHVRRHRKGGSAEVSIYPNGGRKPSAALASLWAHLGIDPDARWKECAADHSAFPAKRSIRTAMDAVNDARKNAAAGALLAATGWAWVDDGAGHSEAPPAQAVDLGKTFQVGVAEWMGQCFLPSLYSNMTERGDRLLEEVLELLQAHGYDRARVPTLVDYVFGRPVGEPAQEVGGVMVTLAGYCWVAGLDMHAAGDAELARINQPDVMAKIRAKQEAKNALHFDTPLPGDPAATDAWPREGDLVRYGDGASALAIRLEPHAGGWHGYQCCGGYTFFTKAYRPSRADMDTWLDCAKYRDGRTKVADNRVAHEMYLLDSQEVGNG